MLILEKERSGKCFSARCKDTKITYCNFNEKKQNALASFKPASEKHVTFGILLHEKCKKKTKEVKITYCNFNGKKNRTRWPPLNQHLKNTLHLAFCFMKNAKKKTKEVKITYCNFNEKVPFFRLGSSES